MLSGIACMVVMAFLVEPVRTWAICKWHQKQLEHSELDQVRYASERLCLMGQHRLLLNSAAIEYQKVYTQTGRFYYQKPMWGLLGIPERPVAILSGLRYMNEAGIRDVLHLYSTGGIYIEEACGAALRVIAVASKDSLPIIFEGLSHPNEAVRAETLAIVRDARKVWGISALRAASEKSSDHLIRRLVEELCEGGNEQSRE